MKNSKLIRILACALVALTVFSVCACKKGVDTEGLTKEGADGLLFAEPEFSRLYNYASTVVVDGDIGHIWYCSNYSSGANGDHIFYRKGVRADDGWYWGEKQLVLSPGEAGAWDSANVCDPSVIKGEFRYEGKTYPWLMAYLGCSTYGNYENAFGLAVAESPAGPWVKVTTTEVAPLYDFYTLYPNAGNNMQLWGTGQPSLVSADKQGKVLVFYTQHFDPDWGQMVERWDFSDLNRPVREFSNVLESNGLLQRDSEPDYITNADFMYDPYRNVLYTGTDVHPFGPDYPNNIPTVGRVAYVDLTADKDGVLGDTLRESVLWTDVGQLSEDVTGNKRHSNLSFCRDVYGWMTDPDAIDVVYASSNVKEEEDWALIYTWRLFRYSLNPNGFTA